MLKQLFFSLLIILFGSKGFCQVVHHDNNRLIMPNLHIGKLIFINECHGVSSNSFGYIDVLKQVFHKIKSQDTVNLFLEIPFSKAMYLNDLVGGQAPRDSIKYYFSQDWHSFIDSILILKLPIHFFGCDFEYDEKYKVNKSYLYALEKLRKKLEKNETISVKLSEYIQSVKAFKVKESQTANLYTSLESQIQLVDKTTATEIQKILFILKAKHNLHSGRDKKIYSRTLEGIKKGYFNYKNSINIIIHGIAHVNPTNKNALFSLFRNEANSPFFNSCKLIGNIYLNCRFTSGLFGNEYFGSADFYVKNSFSPSIFSYCQSLKLSEGQVHRFNGETFHAINFPGLTKSDIIAIYVHNKIN